MANHYQNHLSKSTFLYRHKIDQLQRPFNDIDIFSNWIVNFGYLINPTPSPHEYITVEFLSSVMVTIENICIP